jgi:phosphoribosylanthranilate isomerase
MHAVRVRIKICGVTRPGDLLAAAVAGADAIGLNFHPGSPRHVTLARARELAAERPPFVTLVGLFVNPTADAVSRTLDAVRLDCLQFHGDEADPAALAAGTPYIKALHVVAPLSGEYLDACHAGAQALLLDTADPQRFGGTGRRFDWSCVPSRRRRPIILSGGLDAACVGEAVRRVRPWGVDVASGVEAAPGIKDPLRMRQFVAAVLEAGEGNGDER